MRLQIPTINDDIGDYQQLFALWSQVMASDDSEIVYDFSACEFFRQSGAAFMLGLARLAQQRGKQVTVEGLHEKIEYNMRMNGFLAALGLPAWPTSRSAIPCREDSHKDAEGYIEYLKRYWLRGDRIRLSDDLKNAIVSAVYEAYVNVFDHARSPIGAVTCGQFYPSQGEIVLTLVDFGVGIPATVRAYRREPALSAEAAIRWAFQEGSTTQQQQIARGNGLKILKAFIKRNKGALAIYSEDCHAQIDWQGERFTTHAKHFEGTVVQIRLRSSQEFYSALEEDDADEPFF